MFQTISKMETVMIEHNNVKLAFTEFSPSNYKPKMPYRAYVSSSYHVNTVTHVCITMPQCAAYHPRP